MPKTKRQKATGAKRISVAERLTLLLNKAKDHDKVLKHVQRPDYAQMSTRVRNV